MKEDLQQCWDDEKAIRALRPETPFPTYPKTPRWESDILLTEKIDGTNSTIFIDDGKAYAGSRNRWITPYSDNFGFAAWVAENEGRLVEILGPGLHRGEWFGKGIQRGYGLDSRRFALFNVSRHEGLAVPDLPELTVVPLLEINKSSGINNAIAFWEATLRDGGSRAVPGFMKPEGIVVYHVRANQVFKVPFDK